MEPASSSPYSQVLATINSSIQYICYLLIYSAVVSRFVSKVWLFNTVNIYIKQSYRKK